MQLIRPGIKTYDWGSRSFIQELIGDMSREKIAEIWFGAHPGASSYVEGVALVELLKQDPAHWLGARAQDTGFPYLMKILAADDPLSIQVHPDKAQAEAGYAREDSLGIALDNPTRNYRDPNHKPELIMALTAFDALCGIRDYAQIVDIFNSLELGEIAAEYQAFATNQDASSFTVLYKAILAAPKGSFSGTISALKEEGKYAAEITWAKQLSRYYPDDPFIIAPFIMNLVKLEAQEAIYLPAGIPHAYLKGAGVEIMASSDNVLRAGLTPKHIDKDELLRVVKLSPFIPPIITVAQTADALLPYQVPASDFLFSSCKLEHEVFPAELKLPVIILCISGELELKSDTGQLKLHRGQAAILSSSDQALRIKGKAYFVMAQA